MVSTFLTVSFARLNEKQSKEYRTILLLAQSETFETLARPDTSQRQRRRLPPLPLVIALVPLKCYSRNSQFPHRVPFAKEKMPWCLCPFKSEAYSPGSTQTMSGGMSVVDTTMEEEPSIMCWSIIINVPGLTLAPHFDCLHCQLSRILKKESFLKMNHLLNSSIN